MQEDHHQLRAVEEAGRFLEEIAAVATYVVGDLVNEDNDGHTIAAGSAVKRMVEELSEMLEGLAQTELERLPERRPSNVMPFPRPDHYRTLRNIRWRLKVSRPTRRTMCPRSQRTAWTISTTCCANTRTPTTTNERKCGNEEAIIARWTPNTPPTPTRKSSSQSLTADYTRCEASSAAPWTTS
ncbi:MAG: hypothetical protein U5O39_00360 [Gammaproteobacteria bacterium]|nr:hypothetical protein [Gammaproteobacteria bacterium]